MADSMCLNCELDACDSCEDLEVFDRCCCGRLVDDNQDDDDDEEWVTDDVWLAEEEAIRGMSSVAGLELDEWQVAVLKAYLTPLCRPLARYGVLLPRCTGPSPLCIDGREYRRRSRRRRR